MTAAGADWPQHEVLRASGGKSTSDRGLRVRANVLHRQTERARAFLVEKMIRSPENGALAIGVIKRLATDGHPDSVKLQAASKLAELAGYGAVTKSEHSISVEHRVAPPPPEQLRARLAALIAGASPETHQEIARRYDLPALSASVVDAEFVDVPNEPPAPAGEPDVDLSFLDKAVGTERDE